MKRIQSLKLVLTRETLRRLSTSDLPRVAGGRRLGSDSTAGDTSTPEVSCVACSGACGGSPDPG